MVNAWQSHVKSVMASNPGKSLRDCLKLAAKSYKKSATSATKKARKTKGTKKARKGKGTKKARKGKGKKSRSRK